MQPGETILTFHLDDRRYTEWPALLVSNEPNRIILQPDLVVEMA